jgi:type IV secretory pathway protease TraF
VPLLKTIAAVPRQRVCRIGSKIIIDGEAIGEAREQDRLGRDLPDWQGCRRIGANELFLMNTLVADSFDGLYFGTTPITAVIGKALPIWTTAAGRRPVDNPNTQSFTTTTSTKKYRP